VLGAVLPLVLADFKMSGVKSGLLQSLFLLTYTAVSPLAGWLADTRSRLRLAAVGVLIWSAATCASGLAPAFSLLLVARALSGIGEATYAVVTPSLLSDSYPPNRRGRALAIYFAALPVGTALAYGLGGYVGTHLGWRYAFLMVAGPAVVLSLLLFVIEEPKRGTFDGGAHITPVGLRQSLHELLSRRSYVLNTIAQAIFTFSLGGLALWVPTYLVHVRAIPLETATLRFGIILAVAGPVGTVLGGHIGDALDRRFRGAHFAFAGIATILAVPFIALAIVTRSPWILWPFTFFGLLLLFLITGPLQAAMMNVLPANLRGRGVAMYTIAIHAFGDALSPPLIGWAKDRVGLQLPVLLTVLVLGLAGAILLGGRSALVRDLAKAKLVAR
jgi:MFS transporter, Spinster family, sphingosine-1-phosphate transporter